MSSFSQQVKREIAAREWAAPCCIAAAAYGVACFGKYFDARGVVLHTERAYIAQWAKRMYQLAGVRGKVYVKGEGDSGKTYEFAVKDPFEVEKMLALFGHAGDEPTLRIRPENLACDGCHAAFVAAAFLCCGTVVNPEKGYALEFVGGRFKLMEDFAALLAGRGFAPKAALRKGVNVLYFKASEQVEDLLTYMGAPKAALEIMHLKVYKDFRNRANRITNCETANIDKIVAANRQTLRAIDALEKQGVLETLPEPLQEAARLRRTHSDLSLAELAELASAPVSKSGLSHRFRKINEIAEKLQSAKQNRPQ